MPSKQSSSHLILLLVAIAAAALLLLSLTTSGQERALVDDTESRRGLKRGGKNGSSGGGGSTAVESSEVTEEEDLDPVERCEAAVRDACGFYEQKNNGQLKKCINQVIKNSSDCEDARENLSLGEIANDPESYWNEVEGPLKPGDSNSPSENPSETPSAVPSSSPSAAPSETPSSAPSDKPSDAPSRSPSASPSSIPSSDPSADPSSSPSSAPSSVPSALPSVAPSSSPSTAEEPSDEPSDEPSRSPSASPSSIPSANPSVGPSSSPSSAPSSVPSALPSSAPSSSPSASPSDKPSDQPSDEPSSSPSNSPTKATSTGSTGGSQSFDTRPPDITLNCIIALQGIFPSRTRRLGEDNQEHRFLTGSGSSPFIGEMIWVPYNFAPRGWAFCDGQILSINSNQALYSLIGTQFGGDGRTTFALPDMRGRHPIGSSTVIGAKGGSESQVLTESNLPNHNHGITDGTLTSSVGGGQPFSTMPPYTQLRCIVAMTGVYPSRSRRDLSESYRSDEGRRLAGSEPLLGTVAWVPYTFAPIGWDDCNGQAISISQNSALFSLFGTIYGGDGRTVFNLPFLNDGRTAIHTGQGPGLSSRSLGSSGGQVSTTIGVSEMASHSHSIPGGSGSTLFAGGGQSIPLSMPYQTLQCIIALTGVFPSRNRRSMMESDTEDASDYNYHGDDRRRLQGFEPFIGEIAWVGFNFAPRGWAKCDGQLLPIAQNTALFSLLGTTYGGDGRTTFALPDARGRSFNHDGTGTGPGLNPRILGQKIGNENKVLTVSELPSHKHNLPP